MMNRMGKMVIAFGFLAATVVARPVTAQDEDPYDGCVALCLEMSHSSTTEMTEFFRLVKEERLQDAMDLSFQRAKALQATSCQIWQRYMEHPSIPMSLVWEAATQEVHVWLCLTRYAMLLRRGELALAQGEAKTAVQTLDLLKALIGQAQKYHDAGM